MLVKVFLKSADKEHHAQALKKLYEGIRKDGAVSVEESNDLTYTPCDVAVFFGSWKNRPKRQHHKLKLSIIEQHKKDFIMLETPLLGRQMTDLHTYYRIGVNGFLADTGNFNNKDRDSSRWEILKKDLNLELKPYKTDGENIIIALQLPGDASLRGVDIYSWALKTAQNIRKHTDRKIIFRKHPLEKKIKNPEILKIKNSSLSANPLQKDLENARALVSFTSGVAIDSLIDGIPSYGLNPGSFIHELHENSLSSIENPPKPDRTQWINNLSYCQWSVEEMEQGLVWNHLKEVL